MWKPSHWALYNDCISWTNNTCEVNIPVGSQRSLNGYYSFFCTKGRTRIYWVNRFYLESIDKRTYWNFVPILSQMVLVRDYNPIYLRSVLVVSSHIRLDFPKDAFPRVFPHQNPTQIFSQPHLLALITRLIFGEKNEGRKKFKWAVVSVYRQCPAEGIFI